MSYTKGKLEKCAEVAGLLQINEKTVLCVFPNSCQTVEDIKKREANTERALLCWNCHDGLVAACEKAQIYLDKLKEMERLHADGIMVLGKLEAVLAEAKGKK